MLQAYEKVIDTTSKFGVFIAGPSKLPILNNHWLLLHMVQKAYMFI